MKRSIFFFLIVTVLLTVSAAGIQVQAADNGPSEGDAALYEQAYKLYEEKQYYDAHELFIRSQYGDWERMAKKCVRRWPNNGEIWHDSTQWLRDTNLTFKVEQPEDTAVFIRIYKENRPLSYVFVGGTDTVTVGIPGNANYTIKDGVGSEWYGPTDTFGANGAYETMTFGENERQTVYLESRLNYTITINVEDAIGEDIGYEDEDWQNFTE